MSKQTDAKQLDSAIQTTFMRSRLTHCPLCGSTNPDAKFVYPYGAFSRESDIYECTHHFHRKESSDD
jgi:hypothetical protein